jgi:hypothetical protein
MPPRSIEEYQVGWVCALPKEMTAARAMLDEEYESFKSGNERDINSYVLGRVGEHNVVMACLPAGVYGTNAAATVANNMLRRCHPERRERSRHPTRGCGSKPARQDQRRGDPIRPG